jgi:hypothetical protein
LRFYLVGAFFERPRANTVRPYGQAEPSVDAQPKILSPQIPDLQLIFGRKYAIINPERRWEYEETYMYHFTHIDVGAFIMFYAE